MRQQPYFQTGILAAAFCVALGAGQQSSAEPMTFTHASTGGNCDWCTWIAASGEITTETPEAFRRFAAGQIYKTTVTLDSPGGDLVSGVELGRLIRQFGFDTNVGRTVPDGSFEWRDPGVCASACAYAFLGGVNRHAEPGELGVHRFYDPAALSDPAAPRYNAKDVALTQATVGMLAAYVYEMGVSPDLVFLASVTSADTLHRLTEQDLTDLRVTTDAETTYAFSGWSLEPFGAGLVAISTTSNARGERENLSLYCRSSRSDQLVLMAALHRPYLAEAGPDGVRSAILDTTLTINGYTNVVDGAAAVSTIRTNEEGWIYVSVPLSTDEAAQLTSGSVDFKLGLPHAYGYDHEFSADLNSAGPYIRLAWRNCI